MSGNDWGEQPEKKSGQGVASYKPYKADVSKDEAKTADRERTDGTMDSRWSWFDEEAMRRRVQRRRAAREKKP